MNSRRQAKAPFFSPTGEPRTGDIAITAMTATILLVILLVLAVL